MTPSFSPFLAHLLMAGVARRALLRTDAHSDAAPADDRAPSHQQGAVDVAQAPAPRAGAVVAPRFPRPSVGTVAHR